MEQYIPYSLICDLLSRNLETYLQVQKCHVSCYRLLQQQQIKLEVINLASNYTTLKFSSFDEMFVHLKLQTCFILPGLISAIRSFQKMLRKISQIP